jgi:DNA-binding CsgD family transcriptional regulator
MSRGRPPYPGILTPREQEVVALLQEGLTNDEIAERLGISESGARYHVSEIISKLGVVSRYEAAAWQPAVSGRRFFGVAFIATLLKKLPLERTMNLTVRASLVGAIGVLALIAVGVLIMESRTGGEKAVSLSLLTPETTIELLHGVLPLPGDLPGAGWAVTEDDKFDDPGNYAPVPDCEGLSAIDTRVGDLAIARVQRRLEFEQGPAVVVELAALPTNDLADGLLAEMRHLTDEEVATCLTETVKRQRLDSAAKVTLVDAGLTTPHGGIARADDRDFAIPGRGRVLVHTESHVWTQESVLVSVAVVYIKGAEDIYPINEALTAVLDSEPNLMDALLKSE